MKHISFLPHVLLLVLLVTAIALPGQAVFSAIADADNVKLFAQPSPTAAVVEILKKGDVVKVLEKSEDGKYWEVEHKGHHGWIISTQLSPKNVHN